jgi:SPP1 family predicted phage head-tail adaptor
MSITLTAAELSEIRSAVNELMPDTCTLLTRTNASDGEGGFTETWGTASANVPCRLDSKLGMIESKGNERLAAGEIQYFHTYVLTLPYNTTITEQYRVLLDGQYYQVKSVDFDKSWIASVRAFVERE